jgi:hypothetical protein
MIEIKTKLRKWGNSFGVVVSQKAVGEENVKEGDEVIVLLKKNKTDLKKLFGKLKYWKIDSQKFKDERRKEDRTRDSIFS